MWRSAALGALLAMAVPKRRAAMRAVFILVLMPTAIENTPLKGKLKTKKKYSMVKKA